MSRPREYDQRTMTNIRLDPDLFARLKAAADERGVSVNKLISLAIADFLPRLVPIDALTKGAK